MMSPKKILSSIVSIVPIFLSSINSYGNMSLQDIKEKCIEYRQNNQIKPFNIKVDCRGKYSYWESKEDFMRLMGKSQVVTQTSTKSGQFKTEESTSCSQAPSHRLACAVYTKKEVTSPVDMGISLKIDSCDELVDENIGSLCQEKVREYCTDNLVEVSAHSTSASQENQQDTFEQQAAQNPTQCHTGMCVVREVEVFNTCQSYK